MLQSITLENFFSFSEPTTIDFNPSVNIFLGINSAGKSNLFKAFQLLNTALSGGNIEKLIQEDWLGLDNVINKKADNTKKYFSITYRLNNNITKYEYSIDIFDSVLPSLTKEKLVCTPVELNKDSILTRFEIESHFSEIITREFFKDKQPTTVIKSKENSSTSILFQLGNSWKINQFTFPIYNYFDTSFKSPIRQAAPIISDKYLSPTGENLVHILNHLQHNRSTQYDMLLERMEEINPAFKSIAFMVYGTRLAFALKEKNLDSTILSEHISDGTLRYLLLLSIFCNPDSPEVICIDEPETGLHPDMLVAISELIENAAKAFNKQIFVISHSPLLLNQFKTEDAFFFEKDKHNNTIVRTHSEDDFESDLEHLSLGQLWLTGKLGGTRY